MKYCIKCGSEISAATKFCIKCGAKIDRGTVEPEERASSPKPEYQNTEPYTPSKIGMGFDNFADKFSVFNLIGYLSKKIRLQNVGKIRKLAENAARVIALLATLALFLGMVSCSANNRTYTGVDIIRQAVTANFWGADQWGQVGLLICSLLVILIAVLTFAKTANAWGKILGYAHINFVLAMIMLVYYGFSNTYTLLSGAWMLVFLYGCLFAAVLLHHAAEFEISGDVFQGSVFISKFSGASISILVINAVAVFVAGTILNIPGDFGNAVWIPILFSVAALFIKFIRSNRLKYFVASSCLCNAVYGIVAFVYYFTYGISYSVLSAIAGILYSAAVIAVIYLISKKKNINV